MLRTYWDRALPERGYVVIAPVVQGPTLRGDSALLDGLFDWARQNFEIDASRVAYVGASNGGRGAFLAAEASTEKPHALIAMPGAVLAGTDLSGLSGRPVWLMVGEQDAPWVTAADEARTLLEAAGATVQLTVLRGQGHVLTLVQEDLADWLDQTLGPNP